MTMRAQSVADWMMGPILQRRASKPCTSKEAHFFVRDHDRDQYVCQDCGEAIDVDSTRHVPAPAKEVAS